jgi:NADPH-dependent ferric siderophore reductase
MKKIEYVKIRAYFSKNKNARILYFGDHASMHAIQRILTHSC